ncbi:hypothetical protein F5Y16DRAFT_406112 [Xylariaceae sp. FL0255]|nr:hypothetical protein F5Y16DRAFT_406112 [Xylariaceae sp. FL0255]
MQLKLTGNNTDAPGGQTTATTDDIPALHAAKRKNMEDHSQPGVKRPKPTEVIEISDDEPDNENKISNGELVSEGSVSDSPDSPGPGSEFGGQHANHHITEEEWKRVCKMFQCPPESTTKLKPPGFDIEIAAYHLHAIWRMLTQQPLRDIQGGCLGDALGLGKTIEVLSTFATFAMIKANYAEVKDSSFRCPSQRASPYPSECTCVKSGDSYQIAKHMPSLPTVCVVPPTTMRFWATEFFKILDTTHTIAKHLQISFKAIKFKSKERAVFRGLNESPLMLYPIQEEVTLGWHKVFMIVQISLGGMELPMDKDGSWIRYDLLRESRFVLDRLNRLVRCIIDCKASDRDGRGTSNAMTLARSIAARAWEDQPAQLSQIPGFGPAAVRKWVNHGVQSYY